MSDMQRLRWLCRRGMKELDVVLEAYLEQAYESATDTQRQAFRDLLELPDPKLYGLLLGRDEARDAPQQRLVEALRKISGSA